MGVSENFIGLIQRTNDSFIRDNIYMVGKPLLAKALKNIEPKYQDKVIRNMTNEAAEEVRQLMTGINTINTEDIEAAQREIISMVQGYI